MASKSAVNVDKRQRGGYMGEVCCKVFHILELR